MAVKCTECGASIQDDSKFCKYCGAKIVLDDLKRVEVKIDNTAEIKRASYEEQESAIRQKMMKRELRIKGLKWKICGGIFLIGFAMAVSLIFGGPGHIATSTESAGVWICVGVVAFVIVEWMVKLFG